MVESGKVAGSQRGRALSAAILVTALALGGLVVWRRFSPTEEKREAPIARDAKEFLKEHERRLEEEERENERRKAARTPEENRARIEKLSSLTPEQKQLILESNATVDRIVEEARADRQKERAEDDEARRRLEEKLRKIQEDKEKEKKKLSFAVELASSTILPCQPLVARFRVTNVSDAPVPMNFSLDPAHCCITGEIAPAGATNFQNLALGRMGGPEVGSRNPPQLQPGTTISFQSDLSLFLGFDPATKAVSSGAFTLRLQLDGGANVGSIPANELQVTVAPATGDEKAVLERILKNGYLRFLGTQASQTAPMRVSIAPDLLLSDLTSLCTQYAGSAYVRDLRTGYLTAMSTWWPQLLAKQSSASIAAQIKPILDEYWRRDVPTSWARAESLLYFARVCNFAEDFAREKEALLKFNQACPEDSRAPSVAQALQNRPAPK